MSTENDEGRLSLALSRLLLAGLLLSIALMLTVPFWPLRVPADR